MFGKFLKFEILDPRPAGKEMNDKIFDLGPVFGIEVTIPELAKRCIGNIDPQHSGGKSDVAAIEEAMFLELPDEVSVLATVRSDLDSVGAMALIEMNVLESFVNNNGLLSPYSSEMKARIKRIADVDKFITKGEWKARRLPSAINMWDIGNEASADSVRDLAVLNAAISDQKLSLEERVRIMGQWIRTGKEPSNYCDRVQNERFDMILAIEDGTIRISSVCDDRVALVESGHKSALQLGYCEAPVVIAVNPNFKFGDGEPHRKFTVCQYRLGYIDIKSVVNDLSQLENGWGGSPTIIGSPQGIGSKLTIEQVVEIVEKHLF